MFKRMRCTDLRSRGAAAGLLFAMTSGAALAQSTPKGLEPLPDIPPPPRLSTTPTPEDDESPAITIRQDGENKVEEFRTKGGRLYAVRVTPKIGAPYVLVDPDGKGTMTNATEINGGVRAPQWTLFEF